MVKCGDILILLHSRKAERTFCFMRKIGAYLRHARDSSILFARNKFGNVRKARSVIRVVEGSKWNHKIVQLVVGTIASLLTMLKIRFYLTNQSLKTWIQSIDLS